ncbi:MAG: bis(5'-nucleosyl)-tetraphosphatase, partial [Minisyncoccales bacterium]
MKNEISVGGIIFSLEKEKINYLLLKYPSLKRNRSYWGFAKGRKEKGEKEMDTLKREIEEETGLKKIEVLKGFRETIHYFFWENKEKIFKRVIFYLVFAKEKKVKISFEHEEARWFPFKEAIGLLTFENYRSLLE